MIMSEVCALINNWFDKGWPKYTGLIAINDGAVTSEGSEIEIKEGQYYRVIGSALNDGVWQYGNADEAPVNEEFNGAVWLMGVPPAVTAICNEIEAWIAKYGGVESPGMSPFQSESFAGYSYSKAAGATDSGGGVLSGWQSAFASRLLRWKKL